MGVENDKLSPIINMFETWNVFEPKLNFLSIDHNLQVIQRPFIEPWSGLITQKFVDELSMEPHDR